MSEEMKQFQQRAMGLDSILENIQKPNLHSQQQRAYQQQMEEQQRQRSFQQQH